MGQGAYTNLWGWWLVGGGEGDGYGVECKGEGGGVDG